MTWVLIWVLCVTMGKEIATLSIRVLTGEKLQLNLHSRRRGHAEAVEMLPLLRFLDYLSAHPNIPFIF